MDFYSFDVNVDKYAAVDSLINVVAIHPDCYELTILTDNGSLFIRRIFRDAAISFGARQEFIRYYTQEQNGHVESFHKTLKKEHIWPHEFARYQYAEAVIA